MPYNDTSDPCNEERKLRKRLTSLFAALLAALLTPGLVAAQEAPENSLPLDGHIAPVGTSVELSWFDADPPRVGSVTVRRRLYGQKGGEQLADHCHGPWACHAVP